MRNFPISNTALDAWLLSCWQHILACYHHNINRKSLSPCFLYFTFNYHLQKKSVLFIAVSCQSVQAAIFLWDWPTTGKSNMNKTGTDRLSEVRANNQLPACNLRLSVSLLRKNRKKDWNYTSIIILQTHCLARFKMHLNRIFNICLSWLNEDP